MNNKTARSIPQIIIGNNSIATIDRNRKKGLDEEDGRREDFETDLLDPEKIHLLDLDRKIFGISSLVILELFIPFG